MRERVKRVPTDRNIKPILVGLLGQVNTFEGTVHTHEYPDHFREGLDS